MAELGRAALVVSFGLALYATVAGTMAAIGKQRRLVAAGRGDRARDGARPPRLHVRLRREPHEPRPVDGLLADRVLGRGGGLAAPLAARPDRLRSARGGAQPQAPRRPDRLGRAGGRRRRDVLLV